MFNLVRQPRFGDYIRRVLSMVEGGGVIQLSPELQFQVDADDPDFWALNSGGGYYAASQSQSALALNLSRYSLFNPVGSNLLAFLERIIITNRAAATTTWQLWAQGLALGNTGTGVAMDLRKATTASPIRIEFDQAVAVGAFANQVNVIAVPLGTSLQLTPRFVIPPGQRIGLTCFDVNVSDSVSFEWRQRSAGAQELTP